METLETRAKTAALILFAGGVLAAAAVPMSICFATIAMFGKRHDFDEDELPVKNKDTEANGDGRQG